MGSRTNADTTARATGYHANSYAFLMGLDRSFDTEDTFIRLGVSGGYSSTNVSSGASKVDIESWYIGAYLRAENGPGLFSAAASYGFQDYDFTRVIGLGGSSVNALGNSASVRD